MKRKNIKNAILLIITLIAFTLSIVSSFGFYTNSLAVKIISLAIAAISYTWLVLFVCSNVFRLGARK